MTSHHVTCHVTAMSHASSLSLKRKRKRKRKKIQKKRNIKSRKIDKRKRKMLVSKAFHNTKGMERKMTRKIVNHSRTRRKFKFLLAWSKQI